MRMKFFPWLLAAVLAIIPSTSTNFFRINRMKDRTNGSRGPAVVYADWKAPDTLSITQSPQAGLINYGRQLVLHTSEFFGPHGSLAQISNGMNCQNCHQEGGTKPFANNFSSVASIYPVFKARSGKLETVQIRINDCFERSLNGKPIPDSGKEMKAITAYIYWVGKDVPKGMKTKRSGTENLAFLKRAADTLNGKKVYFTICRDCHGENGGGKLAADGKEYQYPPLWGAKVIT